MPFFCEPNFASCIIETSPRSGTERAFHLRFNSMSKDNENQDVEVDFGDCGDDELLNRCRAGEQDAATALYLRYANRLQSLAEKQTDQKTAVRIDPEGIVQSVFRTFFRRVTDGQYNVADGEDLWKLLLVISLNKLRSQATKHRAQKRDVGKTVPLENSSQKGEGYNNEALVILRMTIDEIVGALPGVEQDIIRLRIEGHEVNDIANKTKRAKRSVERILQNFRKRLRDTIDE